MKKIFIFGACLLLGACSTTKEMYPVAVSKVDATVKMGYLINGNESATIDLAQATEAAAKRCSLWGYSGAEPFGTILSSCLKIDGGTCALKQATLNFQCAN